MHARDSQQLLEARAFAAACGVTRLADITGLDRIGVPVFHAVRPLSRALAVHQGKGLTAEAAQIGALMEAIESDRAEAFDTRSGIGAWQDLAPDERPATLSDFTRLREQSPGPEETLAWARGERLLDGRPIQTPFDSVSLDYSGSWDQRLDHTSNGLGARFDFEGAALRGLLEVLERDGVCAWRDLSLAARVLQGIDPDSIPYPWFGEIAARLADAGLVLSLYNIPTLIGLPAVCAEVLDAAARASGSAFGRGWGCAPAAEEALQRALLEALQSRLTVIAGARDDIFFGDDDTPLVGEALPLPPGMRGLDWTAVAEAGAETGGEVTAWRLADRLAAAGYPETSAVRLTEPGSPVCVVKVFVPGLGAFKRKRRPPE